MIFQDEVTIGAGSAQVWDLLLDVDRFAACMPGVEEVEQIDERTFTGLIAAHVGPMSGKFTFQARIVDSNPPHQMTAEVDGVDSVTKSRLTATLALTLEPAGDHETRLASHATVKVEGRLAILGDMILRATATLLLQEFWKRVRRALETEGEVRC